MDEQPPRSSRETAFTDTAVRPPVSAPTGTSSQGVTVPEALMIRGRDWTATTATPTVWLAVSFGLTAVALALSP